ncbi:hypothetical protein ACHHYP_10494 [Achlya hypogyna]|uniref:Uncharacterized protein n=1 Tax=Achlya hypogyna TaxID=1202772 RepID=A0A1V9YLC0_ACHHY|nr:hypothetical protein ACHHYP_10494 [Achlya hypogyna]
MASNPWHHDAPEETPTGLEVFMKTWKTMTDIVAAEDALFRILCDIDDLTFAVMMAPLLGRSSVDSKAAMLTTLKAQMDAFQSLRPVILQKLQTPFTSTMLCVESEHQQNLIDTLALAENQLQEINECIHALSRVDATRPFQVPELDPELTATLAMYEQCYHAHARLRQLYVQCVSVLAPQ